MTVTSELVTVELLMPIGNSHYPHHGDEWLRRCAPFVRSAGGNRWHRPRSGIVHGPTMWAPHGHTSVRLWCGQATSLTSSKHKPAALTAPAVPAGERLCGTCTGRLWGWTGARVEGVALRFDPMWTDPPLICPGSRKEHLYRDNGAHNRGICLACGFAGKVGAGGAHGYGAHASWGMRVHAPVLSALIPPCPFHGWSWLRATPEQVVVCGCGRELLDEPQRRWAETT